MSDTVQIEGSFGEGGGQIIRTSLSLSALTRRPVRILNIRAKRSKPGLQRQHLTAVLAAAALCNAEVEGAEVGSQSLFFRPREWMQPGPLEFDIRSAGATPLVAQTVLAPLLHAAQPSGVAVIGGTHVPHAPTADYLEGVYLPALRRAGYDAAFHYSHAGYFPKGGGRVEVSVSGVGDMSSIDFTERGPLRSLRAYVATSLLPGHVGERGVAAVERFMRGIGRKIEVVTRDLPSFGPGAAVTVVAECEQGFAGFSALGEIGKPMEKVAQAPCEAFLKWWKSGAAVDEHLADQLVLPLSLVPGESRWTTPRVTEHLRTVLWVVRQFLPVEAEIVEREDGSGMVRIRGSQG